MAEAPSHSLPRQCKSWSDLKAAYRFFSNAQVDPQAMQRPHRELTMRRCGEHSVVLVAQDDSDLNFSKRTKVRGLGMLGDGGGRGFMQHTSLALTERGEVIGLADQFWFDRTQRPEGETRRQSQSRWMESDVWSQAVGRVSDLRASVASSGQARWIHLMDRGGDVWTALQACGVRGDGFVIRAKHDRALRAEGQGPALEADTGARLWSRLGEQPVAGVRTLQVGAQQGGQRSGKRRKREATVSIRFAEVTLRPPVNDPRCRDDAPMPVWAVWVHEDRPPSGEDVQPVQWMLLCSEPVACLADAERVIGWYQKRWVVEEFHRALKEGCRMEHAQLDDAADLRRLASLQSVIAVRLLQLRDWAGMGEQVEASSRADDPRALQATTPAVWIAVVAALARVKPATLTPGQFLLTIAKRGGFIGRKRDGRPGWKTLWQGWYEIQLLVQGAELINEAKQSG